MINTAESAMGSSTATSSPERRRNPRFAFIAESQVFDPNSGISIKGRTADLSYGGFYVDTINPLPSATLVKVRLTNWDQSFEAQARVVYSAAGMGMGLAFVAVDREQLRTLEIWIHKLERQQLGEAGKEATQYSESKAEFNPWEEMQMKIIRIAAVLALAVCATISTRAQSVTPQQWGIVATSESNMNTVDGGPLQFITDWTATTTKTTTTAVPVLANTFTNSACSASGQPSAMAVTYNSTKPTITVTVDNKQTITFTSTSTTASQLKGTFTSSGGGCTQADSGNFTATLYSSLSGSFSGTIESYAETNTVNVTMSLSTASNFNVTGTVQATDKACLADLTINGAAAQAYGPSVATGDVINMFASDTNGNVVEFLLSGTDQNGNVLSPPWPSQIYVTYEVLAGACSGDAGTDAPFIHAQPFVSHPAIRVMGFHKK